MSVFTKRRKRIRQQVEADRKRQTEDLNKFEKNSKAMIKAAKIIDNEHPEFKEMDGYERTKLFAKIYNEVKQIDE